jgi:predicted Fe-Mo cluster-binding NifX family protein
MKIAIATWNGRVSPVFDVSRQILVLEVSDTQVVNRCEETLDESALAKVQRLGELSVKTLLCGAISRPLAEMLAARGIEVIPFVAGGVEDVLTSYLAGQLPSPGFAMPGCCGRQGRFRGGRGCGPGRGGWRSGQGRVEQGGR